jgi:hypothetical protein
LPPVVDLFTGGAEDLCIRNTRASLLYMPSKYYIQRLSAEVFPPVRVLPGDRRPCNSRHFSEAREAISSDGKVRTSGDAATGFAGELAQPL